jgi:hypothetical protein
MRSFRLAGTRQVPHCRQKVKGMISWLIGIMTGMIYDSIGIVARLRPESESRGMKARWALSLGVWNSGGADDYYLEELDRLFTEDPTLLETLEKSLPSQSLSFLVLRKRAWLAGFRATPIFGKRRSPGN